MGSRGHRANIFSEVVTHVGTAQGPLKNTKHQMIVQNFAGKRIGPVEAKIAAKAANGVVKACELPVVGLKNEPVTNDVRPDLGYWILHHFPTGAQRLLKLGVTNKFTTVLDFQHKASLDDDFHNLEITLTKGGKMVKKTFR